LVSRSLQPCWRWSPSVTAAL